MRIRTSPSPPLRLSQQQFGLLLHLLPLVVRLLQSLEWEVVPYGKRRGLDQNLAALSDAALLARVQAKSDRNARVEKEPMPPPEFPG